jgi:hypothetical protein
MPLGRRPKNVKPFLNADGTVDVLGTQLEEVIE